MLCAVSTILSCDKPVSEAPLYPVFSMARISSAFDKFDHEPSVSSIVPLPPAYNSLYHLVIHSTFRSHCHWQSFFKILIHLIFFIFPLRDCSQVGSEVAFHLASVKVGVRLRETQRLDHSAHLVAHLRTEIHPFA